MLSTDFFSNISRQKDVCDSSRGIPYNPCGFVTDFRPGKGGIPLGVAIAKIKYFLVFKEDKGRFGEFRDPS